MQEKDHKFWRTNSTRLFADWIHLDLWRIKMVTFNWKTIFLSKYSRNGFPIEDYHFNFPMNVRHVLKLQAGFQVKLNSCIQTRYVLFRSGEVLMSMGFSGSLVISWELHFCSSDNILWFLQLHFRHHQFVWNANFLWTLEKRFLSIFEKKTEIAYLCSRVEIVLCSKIELKVEKSFQFFPTPFPSWNS